MSPLKQWQKIFKGNLCILANQAVAGGVRVRIASYTRSKARQAALVEFPQGYPVAAPGRSQHQYGLAADLAVTPKTALPVLGSIWLQMGGWWSSADPVHFAFFNPTQWAALLASCAPKAKAHVINPYGPINAPTIGFPPGGMSIPLPPEMPPVVTPNIAAPLWQTAPWNVGAPVGGSLVSQPVSTTIAGGTVTSAGTVTSTAVVPTSVSRGITLVR